MTSIVDSATERELYSTFFQYCASFAATLNIVTSGMHYGWPSPSLPILEDENNTLSQIHISSSEGSWAAIMPLLGAIVGSTSAGATINIVGRKRMILFTCLPYIAAWILIAFAKNFATICASRFIAGITDGCIFTAVPIYIGEISSPEIRGFLGSGVSVALILGILLMNLLGAYLSLSTAALVSTSIPLLCFVMMVWMPRSPYFLVLKNQIIDAKKSLQILRGTNNVDFELRRLIHAVDQQRKQSGKLLDVLKVRSNRKALLIMMLLRAAQQLSGITAITFYTGLIFKEAGTGISHEIASIIFFSMQLIICFISCSIVDYFGRRPLLIVSSVGSTVALLVEATYFYFKQSGIVDLSGYEVVPLVALIAYIVNFSVGLQNIPILVLGELFPTTIKGYAVCFADLYFALLAAGVSKFFQIVKDSFGIYVPFYAFMVSCLAGLVLITLFVPETKGKTLEEIQLELKGEILETRTSNN